MNSEKQLTVLYIEDDQGLARLTKKRLEREGFLIDIVPNGEDGLAALDTRKYSVLLVDYEMPGMNGVEVIRELSRGENPPPVVMVTGNGDERVAIDALKQGASDYIIKDLQMNYLELLPHVIMKVLRKHQLVQEKERMVEALKESEERYRRLIELSMDIILIHRKGKILYINPQGAFFFKASNPQDLAGRSIYAFFHQDSWPLLREKIDEFERVGQRLPWTEVSLMLADGTVLDAELSAVGFRYQGDLAVQVVIRDISEKKKMTWELERARRFESIGILAGGVAHDFNNILAGIMGNVSLAKKYVQRESEGDRMIEEAEKGVKKAKDITFNLLSFARGTVPEKRDLMVRNFMENTAEFAVSGSDVQYLISLPDDLWKVTGDEMQIRHVFHNLIRNAVEAMPRGGTVLISAENAEIDHTVSDSLSRGKYVKFTFTDEGVGISEEDSQKIFDPYFSTKDMGSIKGTGLGLSICYSIVRDHDGHISVSSQKGHGSTFTVYLPAADQ